MLGLRRLALGAVCLVMSSPSIALADSLAPGAPSDTFELSERVGGLTEPTSFAFLPDGTIVVIQKTGEVLLADALGATRSAGRFVVDPAAEKGLLNVVVHPDFGSNRRLLFYYSDGRSPAADKHRVSSVVLGTNGQLDMASEQILLRGLRGTGGHNGGAMAIGPDGKLYIGVGDTGCNSKLRPETLYRPTNFYATCLTNGNGKILRINLDGSIPSDNPLFGMNQVSACDNATCSTAVDPADVPPAAPRAEVWAWGLRNPWRFWFDPVTENLWIGDVGEISYEEINVLPRNSQRRHFGWPYREGAVGHPTSSCRAITPDVGDCVEPVYFCKHDAAQASVDDGCRSIMGGVIADSCEWPAPFRGRYYFADSRLRRLYSLEPTTARDGIVAGSRQDFGTAGGEPVHVALAPDGALYWVVIAAAGASYITRAFPRNPETCATPDAGSGGTGGGSAGAGPAGSGGSGPSGSGGSSAEGAGGTASGTGGAGATSGSGGGNRPGANGGSGGAEAAEESGCGCRLASGRSSAALLGLMALGLLAASARRKRERD
jgi:glucose/arabinose dehydrogenase